MAKHGDRPTPELAQNRASLSTTGTRPHGAREAPLYGPVSGGDTGGIIHEMFVHIGVLCRENASLGVTPTELERPQSQLHALRCLEVDSS